MGWWAEPDVPKPPRELLPLVLFAVIASCVNAPAEQKVLYEKDSPYNTILVTEDDQGLRTLRFERGGVRQSVVKVGDPDHIELPYAQAMLVGLALVEQPRRVLVVGLGGGTLPAFLHKHYPQATVDAVDVDPDVVDVAKKFFGFREDSTLHAHVCDGRRFIEQCRRPYDIIFLDAYGSESVPYHLATREFLQAVGRALAPQGVVVANVFGPGSNSLYNSMARTYQAVFEEFYVFDVQRANNQIFVAIPSSRRIQRDDPARQGSKLSQKKNFRFDLGEAVTSGYHRAGSEEFLGPVLTDQKKSKKAP